MAFAAAALTDNGLDRSFSIGPVKVQLMKYGAASGDTSGTVTATGLTRIAQVHIVGSLALTSDATYSGNVATLEFADPAATVKGTIICIGV